MRLARVGPPGRERPVVLTERGLVDVSRVCSDFGPEFFGGDGFLELADFVGTSNTPLIASHGVRYGPCIARPGKIVCVGLNYIDHANEAGMEIPSEPLTFLKAPSAICGPTDDILLPVGSDKVDWEIELGVVIGQQARYLPDHDSALKSIAGLCISNDVSERSFQLERGGQWSKGKSCETFNPLGPILLSYHDSMDLNNFELTLSVNGETKQQATTKDLIFDIAEIIRYLSQFMVLEPGDLINTGTPPGTGLGLQPPQYLREGDTVEGTISGLGVQTQLCMRATK